jgi:hypothetical protein
MSMQNQRAALSNAQPAYQSYAPWLEATPPAVTKIAKKKRERVPGTGMPPAMIYGEVLRKKTPLERASEYARKMNELATEESGLGDWIDYVKLRSMSNTHAF